MSVFFPVFKCLAVPCKGKVISALVVDSTCAPQNPHPQRQPRAHSLALPHDQVDEHVMKRRQTPAVARPSSGARKVMLRQRAKGLFHLTSIPLSFRLLDYCHNLAVAALVTCDLLPAARRGSKLFVKERTMEHYDN